jgi:hypothetical protein
MRQKPRTAFRICGLAACLMLLGVGTAHAQCMQGGTGAGGMTGGMGRMGGGMTATDTTGGGAQALMSIGQAMQMIQLAQQMQQMQRVRLEQARRLQVQRNRLIAGQRQNRLERLRAARTSANKNQANRLARARSLPGESELGVGENAPPGNENNRRRLRRSQNPLRR